jgi:hypothetical protein
MRDLGAERDAALAYAVDLHRIRYQRCDAQDVTATADRLFTWLTAPTHLVITPGPAIDQATGKPTGGEGNPMKDTEKSQVSIVAEDAKNQPTNLGTDIQWSSADETIATVTTDPADGSVWVVAGTPGSTVITGTWPDSPAGSISGTLAVDVTAGDAVSLSITAGAPVPQ